MANKSINKFNVAAINQSGKVTGYSGVFPFTHSGHTRSLDLVNIKK